MTYQSREGFIEVPLGIISDGLCLLGLHSGLGFLSLYNFHRVFSNQLVKSKHILYQSFLLSRDLLWVIYILS